MTAEEELLIATILKVGKDLEAGAPVGQPILGAAVFRGKRLRGQLPELFQSEDFSGQEAGHTTDSSFYEPRPRLLQSFQPFC